MPSSLRRHILLYVTSIWGRAQCLLPSAELVQLGTDTTVSPGDVRIERARFTFIFGKEMAEKSMNLVGVVAAQLLLTVEYIHI